MLLLVLLVCACAAQARVLTDKSDRYLIACHSTDFKCFQRQYVALRDQVLLDNSKLSLEPFTPSAVQYGDSCVRLTGWNDSQLVGIGMNSASKQLTMFFTMPLYIKQGKGKEACSKPIKEFPANETITNNGTPMEFTANVSVSVTFPFALRKKKNKLYLMLNSADVDALVDVPVYLVESGSASDIKAVTKLNKMANWAQQVVEHVDAASTFVVPFTSRIRIALQRIPISRLLLLYPEEDYPGLNFTLVHPEYRNLTENI